MACTVEFTNSEALAKARINFNDHLERVLSCIDHPSPVLHSSDGTLPAGEYSLYDVQALYDYRKGVTTCRPHPPNFLNFLREVQDNFEECVKLLVLEILLDWMDDKDFVKVTVSYE
jgi:hypothetical protein